MDCAYDCIVTYQTDDLTDVTLKRTAGTEEKAESWILESMCKAVRDNPNIEVVSGDWEHAGMGKTYELAVGF